MSMHEELVKLYGSGKVAEIEQGQGFAQLCAKYRKAEGFEPERLRIRDFRANLEEICCGQTNQAQVRLCLKLLSVKKKDEDRTDYHDLIIDAYYDYWSEPQKKHFDHLYAILKGDVYFFLSFTTRSNTPMYASKVNKKNRYFLADVFWPKELSKVGDLTKENMLAAAIYRYLEEQGLSGFYYPRHEGMSNHVEKRLRTHCRRTLTFVQLVQGVMFESKEPNFCHFEYKEARQSELCRKRIYIMGEERADILARKNIISEKWLPWFDEITKDKDALELVSTRYRDDVAVQKNHKELKEKIVRQIEHIRDELFEKIPG